MWACCLTVIFAFLVCFVCSSFLTSHSFLHAGILSHALSFSHTLISLTFPSLCCHTLSHNIVLNPFHTLTLTFSFHFSALLLVVSPSLFLVHSLSGVLPLSCHLSLSSTHLSHAGSFSCNHAPIHHGLYPILFLSFLVATLSHTFAFLLAFLSMPSFVTPFLISLHLIFFGALSLSRAHSSSFPGSVSHCLLSTSHSPVLPTALTAFPFPYVHSSSGKLYFSSSISVSCSLSCPLPLAFVDPLTFTHSLSLPCYLISFFLFSTHSLL